MDRAIINIFGIKFWAETKLIRLVMPHEVNFKGKKNIKFVFFFFCRKKLFIYYECGNTRVSLKFLWASTIPYWKCAKMEISANTSYITSFSANFIALRSIMYNILMYGFLIIEAYKFLYFNFSTRKFHKPY